MDSAWTLHVAVWAFSHPFDEAYIRAELVKGNQILSPVAGAMALLLGA
jgi:hypothetical protein